MENAKELIKETTDKIDRKSEFLRADRTTKLQQYINGITSQIEDEIKAGKYHLLPRFLGEINDILNHLESQVNTFNDEELRQLATDAITDLESLNQQEEKNEYDELKHTNESNKERVTNKKNFTKNKDENNKSYMDYTREAIKMINREFQSHKTINLTPLQIVGLNDLSNRISKNLLVSMQQIHDEGIHMEGRLIEEEINQLSNVFRREVSKQDETHSNALDANVLDNPFALEHYGGNTKEFNEKAIQIARETRQNQETHKEEKDFNKVLPDNILE